MKSIDPNRSVSDLLNEEGYDVLERETLIRKISSTLYSSLDSETILQTIVNELGQALSVCRCSLSLLHSPMPGSILITNDYQAECCQHTAKTLAALPIAGTDIVEAALALDRPMVFDNVETDERLAGHRDHYRSANIHSLIVSSIRLNQKPIGVFGLHKCTPYKWADWEINLVETIAEQAALAIRQAELLREAKEGALRANLVTHIVTSMRRSLDLKEILQSAASELGKALGVNRVYFRRLIGDVVRVEAQYASQPIYAVDEQIIIANKFVVEYLTKNHKTLVIDNLEEYDAQNSDEGRKIKSLYAIPRAQSIILYPMFINDVLWGGFFIGQVDRQRKWTQNEIAVIEAVAAQIEIAILHSEVFNEAKQAATIESLIRHISQTINQAETMAEVYREVGHELGNFFHADSLIISRYDSLTGLWHIECATRGGVAYTPEHQTYKESDFAKLAVIRKDGWLISNDVENDRDIAPFLETVFRPAGIKAFLILNLFYEENTRLSIGVFSKTDVHVWSPQEINIMRSAGDQMLIAFKRAELFAEVLRSKNEWESTFDALADGLLIFDENGILRRVNQAGAAMEGKSIDEMLGRTCCSLMQGIENDSCKVMQVMETGEPITFEIVPEMMSRPVLVTISPLWKHKGDLNPGSNGSDAPPSGRHALGAVCIVRDLSELRAAEASAREQRNYLVKLVEHARDAICALTPSGSLIWCNDHFMTMFDQPRHELMGLGYQKFIPESERLAVFHSFRKALDGETQATEFHGHNRNNEEMLMMITFIPIYDVGRVTGILMLTRDITQEKLASDREAQAEKMRMLGQIAAGVAHNFNNILAAVLGHAQLIKRALSDERVIKQAEIIERAALDGAEMVKRIQSFGNQQKDAGYEPVDLNQLVRDSVGLTRAGWEGAAQARGITYEVEMDLQQIPIIYGSASEIREVFVNIILNSLDAMPSGGTLKIATRTVRDLVLIHFTDMGVGMSEEVRRHIFEPFFTTKGPSGTGLGLAVSYSAIERHGGTIEVTSAPDRGSTFTVCLPSEEISRFINRQKQGFLPSPRSSRRILLVDDDERVRSALEQMIKILGYQVEVAENGTQALGILEEAEFDLVLTDLSMPGMDGWTVAGEIRRKFPPMKIIILTGYGNTGRIPPLRQDIADEILSKPVRIDELSVKISQLLK